jgi:hypothetical protein
MKTFFLSILVASVPLVPLQADDAKATALADAVVKASGGDNWSRVKSIHFTFNVAQGDKTLTSVAHHWDVWAGTDTVTWGGKTVTVNVWNPGSDDDAKAAYKRWVNDSYWLLAPLKLKDRGVRLAHMGRQEVEGKQYEVLHLGFAGVGLTPGDQYNLYIDPDEHLVRRWDYMPNAEKKMSGTWSEYKDFHGLKLSIDRHFGDKHIWFSDVKVEAQSAEAR